MPQMDLETLFRMGSGRKVVCETLVEPAESFLVSAEDEIDWFDQNAFFDRNHSTKAFSNPNPSSSKRAFHPNVTSKPSIIGPPSAQLCHTFRRSCRPPSIRFFPKSAQAGAEPESPKVSCMGRVRSKEKASRSQRRRLPEESTSGGKSANGIARLLVRVLPIFRCQRKFSSRRSLKPKSGSESESRKECSSRQTVVDQIPAVEPAAGTAVLKKLASGISVGGVGQSGARDDCTRGECAAVG